MPKYINLKKYPGVQLYFKANGDVSYSIRIKDQDGKTRRVKIGNKSQGITEAYCNKKRNELLHKIRIGENDPLLKEHNTMTLNEAAERYYEEKALYNKDNHRQHGNYKRMFSDSLGNKQLGKINESDLKKVQRGLLNKNRQPKTINGYIGMILSIFNYTIQNRLYNGQNPAQHIKRYNTIRRIQKKHINFENRSVPLFDIKNDTTYTGFLDLSTTTLLKEYAVLLKPNDYLFIRYGELYTERSLQRHLKNILDKLFNEGLDKKDSKNRAVVHTLRHTFASHLAMNGTPLLTIQKLMNHKDIKMTMRYAKLAPDAGKDAIDSLYM